MVYFKRKMRCPRHYLLMPGRIGFVMERDKLLKNFTLETLKRYKINPLKKKRDKWGNPIRKDTDYYQPEISGAFAIEHIYDPKNPICVKCNNRCWEGLGTPSTRGIGRLHGRNSKGITVG